ncbi:neurotrypsin-like [Amphiura filiformis]|uniref:neurotrypsin-like n=1 Tax=Amphiura filiformis TaxID=82378 RepID=UPI003B20CE38
MARIRRSCVLAVFWYSIQLLYAMEGTSNHTYEYRVVNGDTSYEGRLEIRRNGGIWGTVGGQYWTSKQASVACRSLGFSSSTFPPDKTKRYGTGSGPVHVKILRCLGNELSLLECEHTLWDDPERIDDHTFDMGVKCLPAGLSHSLRLLNEYKPNEGVVQVYDGVSKWGYMCCKGWAYRPQNADTICRYFGYQLAIRSYCVSPSITEETDIFIESISCPFYSGSGQPASTLEECILYPWHLEGSCLTNSIIAVECLEGNTTNTKYDLRIGDSYGDNAGVIQARLFNEDQWRILCFRWHTFTSQENVREILGRFLCSKVNNNGDNEVRNIDKCELSQIYQKERPLSISDGRQFDDEDKSHR